MRWDVALSDEGEYTCPVCTIFGIDEDEVKGLIEAGFKMTDHNKGKSKEIVGGEIGFETPNSDESLNFEQNVWAKTATFSLCV